MKCLFHVVSAILLLTVPATHLYPNNPIPIQLAVPEYTLSFDDVLNLFSQIESGQLEKKCSPEQLGQLTFFIASLAKDGVLPDNSEESLSLDDDVKELFNGDEFIYDEDYSYIIVPAILNGHYETIFCKSWIKKQWGHVRKFIKKHKKALLIGAAALAAAAAVAGSVMSAPAAPSAGDASGAAPAPSAKKDEAPQEAPNPAAAFHEQKAIFKENLVENQFFAPTNPKILNQELSWEENARTLGSLFAHDYLSMYPGSAGGHLEIDREFSTDFATLYSNPNQDKDFNTLAYQARGERALTFGYYNQAVQDLGKVIESNPNNPTPYLERGVAHFGLGQYEKSLEDYRQFTTKAPSQTSLSEFSVGFAKGLPKGVYESGEGMFLFLADFATHPIRTAGQMAESISKLVDLARNEEWNLIAESLSPEMHTLVSEWDNLPSDQRGELAGFALGKHGADILAPGGIAKLASKSVKSAQELAAICKNIKLAQDTLVLETAAGIGSTAKIAEVIEVGQITAFKAEELGMTTHEMGQLKSAGTLESTVENGYQAVISDPVVAESAALHRHAGEFLKPFKGYMSEFEARELIHRTGIRTFSRPNGIPENYRVKLSNKGAGIKYVHPENENTYIRVMPGKPHSPLTSQRNPYVTVKKNGQSYDNFGNKLPNGDLPEAHIPLEEFIYRDN